uniref:Uncharacterized protein n=1 Tax=Anguilla anguilla TaxID=7936 RepID=A0A0E9UJ55_ANGAN
MWLNLGSQFSGCSLTFNGLNPLFLLIGSVVLHRRT